jgi:hypothetical protein
MDELQEWTCDANKAVILTLGPLSRTPPPIDRKFPQPNLVPPPLAVRSAEDALSVIDEDPEARVLLPFQPKFTYPIFGEKELIYGYKGLSVEVSRSRRGGPGSPLSVYG